MVSVRVIALALLVVVAAEAGGIKFHAEFEGKKFFGGSGHGHGGSGHGHGGSGHGHGGHKTPSNESLTLLDLLEPQVQDALPKPLKQILDAIEIDEVKGLKEVIKQLPQITDPKKIEELLKEKSPTILALIKKLAKKLKDLFQQKKAKLSAESLQFFAEIGGVSKESLKKVQKIIQELKPEVKDNLKQVFPEIADLIQTPAGQKLITPITNGTIA